MADDEDKELIRLAKAGRLDEFKEKTQGKVSIEVLKAAARSALENRDVKMLEHVLLFEFTQDNRVRKPFLFSGSERVGDGWKIDGDGPWIPLFETGKGMEDSRFAACARMLIAETSFSSALPVSFSNLSGPRPLSVAAHRGEVALIEELLRSGVPPNGYSPSSDSRYFSTKPEVSPLSSALRAGRGKAALTLLSAGAAPNQDDQTRCKGASLSFIGADKKGQGPERMADARMAFRIALNLDGWERSEGSLLSAERGNPLDCLASLEVWLAKRAIMAERLAAPAEPEPQSAPAEPARQPKPAPEKPIGRENLSFFGRLTRSLRSSAELGETEPAPEPKGPEPKPSSRQEEKRAPKRSPVAPHLEALTGGSPRDFARELSYLQPEERVEALVQAWALAKSAFWRMPLPGGVGDQGREPTLWGCFKAAAAQMGAEELNAPIKDLGGLSLMAAASALGHADVCSCLAQSGASVDPDPLMETAAPLALAIRFGHSDLAMSLLEAGADPMEGFKAGAFDLPFRGWAIHEALEAGEGRLYAELLEAKPECASLKNAAGLDVMAALDAKRLTAPGEKEREGTDAARALCEAALIKSAPKATARLRAAGERSKSI